MTPGMDISKYSAVGGDSVSGDLDSVGGESESGFLSPTSTDTDFYPGRYASQREA